MPFFSVTLETEEEEKAEEEKESSVKDDSTTTPEVRIKQSIRILLLIESLPKSCPVVHTGFGTAIHSFQVILGAWLWQEWAD